MDSPSIPSAVQLPLAIRWNDTASFESFYRAGNGSAVEALERLLAGREVYVYLHGAAGTGKSHLLQAAARHLGERGVAVAYVPLGQRGALRPAVLDGLEELALVALDDVEQIAGDPGWEEALFHVFNRVGEAGGRLLLGASNRPDAIGLRLPDLVSRLQGGLLQRLRRLDDEERLEALRHRARLRGLELPEEAGRYLLRRQPRDLESLFALLETLDRAALAEQRRLTVPFVRRVLAQR